MTREPGRLAGVRRTLGLASLRRALGLASLRRALGLASLRRALGRAQAFHDELFMAPWRAGVEREARRQRDLLVALAFCEALGVENPASYQTLELYPELVAAYHDWHRRQGLPTGPHPGICC